MAPRALRHHQRKNIFIFANQENLRIFLICFFHGKSCFLCRERSRGTGLRAFIKFFSVGDAPLKDFLCCADFKASQSLRDSSPQGSERQQMQLLATAPSREKANQE